MSTVDPRYVLHTVCGELVKATYGLPDASRHTCIKDVRENMAYGNGKCFDCGATVEPKSRTQHSNFHTNFIHRSEVKDGFAVSAVKWCDAGNHAFKANSPGSQSVDVVQRDESGDEVRVVMDMCADHAFNTGPRPDRLREVEQAYEQTAPVNAVSAYPYEQSPLPWNGQNNE